MKGRIFDIQNYALHDGPGVRSCVFFKGCPLRCAWCHNPESQRPGPQLAFDAERCTACGRCLDACPQGARTLKAGRVHLARERCTACGACAGACIEGASELVGQDSSVEQVITRVMPDRPFFDSSGGGVTLSGGEPTAQPDFLIALLDGLRAQGIHTALETCGAFGAELVEPLSDRVDLFLFDLKHASEERHRAATGRGNRAILDNLGRLLARVGPERLVPRLPVIPDFNADPDSLADLAALLRDRGYAGPVHLMAYHPWAAQKYARLGRVFSRRPALSDEARAGLAHTFDRFGLKAEWN